MSFGIEASHILNPWQDQSSSLDSWSPWTLQQRVDGLEDGDGISEEEGDELLKIRWKARIALAVDLLGLLLDGGGFQHVGMKVNTWRRWRWKMICRKLNN